MKGLLTGLALLPCLCPKAQAQIHSIDPTPRFMLKPPVRLTLLTAPAEPRGPRPFSLAQAAPTRDEAAVLLGVARQTMQFSQQRESGARAPLPLAGHLSRTRVRTIRIEGLLPVDDRASFRLGWSGAKYSNRNANVTAAYSNANLRAKDWLQPHAALHWTATKNLWLRAAYDESLRAYADVSMSGPLGLRREDFRQLQDRLRPERHRRMTIGAGWSAAPGFRVALDVYRGRLDDRLTFAEGSALPVNHGSARLLGGMMTAAHQVAPSIGWSLRYSHARVEQLDGDVAQERRLAGEGYWQVGAWRASLSAAHTSAAALIDPGAASDRAIRLSAAVSFQPPSLPGLAVGLRITDPDRLASSAFLAPDAPLGLRAQDQARGFLLSASLLW
ncbi:MAG TPA: hypothetical protein DCG90_13510 [Sphingobium sp.]|uniref:TonB-dependent receptor domain-containing protein n=1 Tax=Sphingobium sp. TaxID=1912891 RepID=UPI000ED3CB92|nr:TonB-dependent receptor [Sphingobium sp.]HAF42760.1 hypothetical protein [Sphingobium sp.]